MSCNYCPMPNGAHHPMCCTQSTLGRVPAACEHCAGNGWTSRRTRPGIYAPNATIVLDETPCSACRPVEHKAWISRAETSAAEPECRFCTTMQGIVLQYESAVARLRPGHTDHCNSGFVHGHGECSCMVRAIEPTSDEIDATARALIAETDAASVRHGSNAVGSVPWEVMSEETRAILREIARGMIVHVRGGS